MRLCSAYLYLLGVVVSTGRKPFVALKCLSLYEKLMTNKSYIYDISSTVKVASSTAAYTAAISLRDVTVAGWPDPSLSLISILLDLTLKAPRKYASEK